MNHISRLAKRQARRRGKFVDESLLTEAHCIIARLAGRVVDDASTLKSKGFAWALSACAILPLRSARC